MPPRHPGARVVKPQTPEACGIQEVHLQLGDATPNNPTTTGVLVNQAREADLHPEGRGSRLMDWDAPGGQLGRTPLTNESKSSPIGSMVEAVEVPGPRTGCPRNAPYPPPPSPVFTRSVMPYQRALFGSVISREGSVELGRGFPPRMTRPGPTIRQVDQPPRPATIGRRPLQTYRD
jgi:hypothetical protein